MFTRIVWIADIATPLRDWVWAEKRGGTSWFLGRLIRCPWCIAPYLATPLTFISFAVDGALGSWAGVWHAMLTAAAVSFFAPALMLPRDWRAIDGTVHSG